MVSNTDVSKDKEREEANARQQLCEGGWKLGSPTQQAENTSSVHFEHPCHHFDIRQDQGRRRNSSRTLLMTFQDESCVS